MDLISNPVPPIPPVIPAIPQTVSTKPRKPTILIFLIMLLVLISLSITAYFLYQNRELKKQTATNPAQGLEKVKPEREINCEQINNFTEDKEAIYALCDGGVRIIDKQNKTVKDVTILTTENFGKADNAKSLKTNSIAKVNDKIYIATEINGITVYDLKTEQKTLLDRKSGLAYNTNVILAQDGNYLWIGTFGGLNRLNLSTGEIDNLTSELKGATSIEGIVITSSFVYIRVDLLIAVYDKKNNTWEHYGKDTFGEYPAYYNTELAAIDDQIFIKIKSKTQDSLFFTKKDLGSSWLPISKISQRIKTDFPVIQGCGAIANFLKPINRTILIEVIDYCNQDKSEDYPIYYYYDVDNKEIGKLESNNDLLDQFNLREARKKSIVNLIKNPTYQILSTFKFTDPSCRTGGCSGELCQNSSAEPVFTTCEYLEKYSCYAKATCEKQDNGQCGWTQTEELKSCLSQF